MDKTQPREYRNDWTGAHYPLETPYGVVSIQPLGWGLHVESRQDMEYVPGEGRVLVEDPPLRINGRDCRLGLTAFHVDRSGELELDTTYGGTMTPNAEQEDPRDPAGSRPRVARRARGRIRGDARGVSLESGAHVRAVDPRARGRARAVPRPARADRGRRPRRLAILEWRPASPRGDRLMARTFWGETTPREEGLAETLARSQRFDDDSVRLYDELVEKHGVESAGRIWILAGRIYDREHGAEV